MTRSWKAVGVRRCLVGVIAVGALVLTGCGGGTTPEGAHPTYSMEVVQAYVARLSAGDRDGAREFLTAIGARNGGAPIGTGSMRGVTFDTPKPIPKTSNGRNVADAVRITIHFDRENEQDPTLETGRVSWDFTVVREGPEDPWRIDDQGVG